MPRFDYKRVHRALWQVVVAEQEQIGHDIEQFHCPGLDLKLTIVDGFFTNLFLELEDEASPDVLDDTRSPGFLELLDICEVLMLELVDEEDRTAAIAIWLPVK